MNDDLERFAEAMQDAMEASRSLEDVDEGESGRIEEMLYGIQLGVVDAYGGDDSE